MELKQGYKQTDIGVIPENWKVSEFQSLGLFHKGKGIRKDEVKSQGLPCVRYGELYTIYNNVIKSTVSFISLDIAKQSYKLSYGDLLFAGSGETKKEIGKSAVILRDDTYAGGDIVVFRPKNIDPVFLGHVSNSNPVIKQKAIKGQGDAVVHIYSNGISKIKIPLPPLPEQKAIAQVLNDTDSLIQAIEKKLAKKRAIKQGAMQQLLTPKENWKVKQLGEIGEGIIGLTYSPNDVRKTGILVLRSSNVQNGQLSFKDNVFVEMNLPDRVIVKENDILICVRNGSKRLIGKCALIDKKAEGSAFGAFMTIYRSKYSRYVFYVFQSQYIQRQIDEVMGATINQITNKDLNSFEIPFPKIEEQIRIAAILSDMDADIEQLEQKLSKYKMVKQGLMQELLTGKIRLV